MFLYLRVCVSVCHFVYNFCSFYVFFCLLSISVWLGSLWTANRFMLLLILCSVCMSVTLFVSSINLVFSDLLLLVLASTCCLFWCWYRLFLTGNRFFLSVPAYLFLGQFYLCFAFYVFSLLYLSAYLLLVTLFFYTWVSVWVVYIYSGNSCLIHLNTKDSVPRARYANPAITIKGGFTVLSGTLEESRAFLLYGDPLAGGSFSSVIPSIIKIN